MFTKLRKRRQEPTDKRKKCPACESWDDVLIEVDIDDWVCPVCWASMVCTPDRCISCEAEVDYVEEYSNIIFLKWEQTGELKSLRHIDCAIDRNYAF
jgi:hypothetical protein